jgi:hypothetical protein
MCNKAIKEYSANVVGEGDSPIRKFLKPTLRELSKGKVFHGYADKSLKEVFVFDFFWNFIINDIKKL